MSLTNIKLNSKSERGFTIVELLIVVVVIAILAAITIVSYNGITNRANQSASKSAASNVQKKAELYYADQSSYPTQLQLTGAASDKPFAGLTTASFGTPDATNGKTTVLYAPCGTAPHTGATIDYWNFGDDNDSLTSTTLNRITVGSGC